MTLEERITRLENLAANQYKNYIKLKALYRRKMNCKSEEEWKSLTVEHRELYIKCIDSDLELLRPIAKEVFGE